METNTASYFLELSSVCLGSVVTVLFYVLKPCSLSTVSSKLKMQGVFVTKQLEKQLGDLHFFPELLKRPTKSNIFCNPSSEHTCL